MTRTGVRAFAALVVCVAAAACATPQTDALLQRPPDTATRELPARSAVAAPVFFAQEALYCGPAALAMMLVHAGVDANPDALAAEVYTPGRAGSLASAMLAAARRHGRIAYPVGGLAALLGEIARGRQVLVLQNLGLSWLPRWHYAVAVGYDLAARTITLHSGTTRFLTVPLATFERTWARGGHWALLTLRPGAFPERVHESTYMSAVAGVERAGRPNIAADAYAAALARWPENPVALMGHGNALYGMGHLRAAAEAFRTAAARLPGNADAFNNLGHVLADLGEMDAAETAARTAVGLGGPNLATYQETLRRIRAR